MTVAPAADNSPLVDLGFDGSLPRSFLRPALHIALLDGPTHGYELLEYVQEVRLDGRFTEKERTRDVGVARALSYESEHLSLAWSQ